MHSFLIFLASIFVTLSIFLLFIVGAATIYNACCTKWLFRFSAVRFVFWRTSRFINTWPTWLRVVIEYFIPNVRYFSSSKRHHRSRIEKWNAQSAATSFGSEKSRWDEGFLTHYSRLTPRGKKLVTPMLHEALKKESRPCVVLIMFDQLHAIEKPIPHERQEAIFHDIVKKRMQEFSCVDDSYEECERFWSNGLPEDVAESFLRKAIDRCDLDFIGEKMFKRQPVPESILRKVLERSRHWNKAVFLQCILKLRNFELAREFLETCHDPCLVGKTYVFLQSAGQLTPVS